jgi:hypothetical protein
MENIGKEAMPGKKKSAGELLKYLYILINE